MTNQAENIDLNQGEFCILCDIECWSETPNILSAIHSNIPESQVCLSRKRGLFNEICYLWWLGFVGMRVSVMIVLVIQGSWCW